MQSTIEGRSIDKAARARVPPAVVLAAKIGEIGQAISRTGGTGHGQALSGGFQADSIRCHTISGGFSERRFFRVPYPCDYMRFVPRGVLSEF